MWKLSWSVLLLAAVPAFAQLESHTLTISATRQINLEPDQALFSVTVSSNAAVSLDQIVAALSGLSITSANLSGVSDFTEPQTLQWSFTLAVPLSSLSGTIGSLAKLQQTIGQNNSGLTLTFSINGTQASAQLQAQPCSTSNLIADATAQAQKLAAAAGLAVGPILRLSNAPSIQPAAAIEPTATGLAVNLVDFLLAAAPPTVTCSLVVEFQLNL